MTIEYFKRNFECKWSKYEIAHGLDQPWQCHMPNVIGYIAVTIGLTLIIHTIYGFMSYIHRAGQLPTANSVNTLLSMVEE